jgi:hypothetical protein
MISENDGPILDHKCQQICHSCKETIMQGTLPKFSLAQGLWLGKVPDELQNLSFVEQLLIDRVRHNWCIVKVAKGMHKMIVNAVVFEHPMQNIYIVFISLRSRMQQHHMNLRVHIHGLSIHLHLISLMNYPSC